MDIQMVFAPSNIIDSFKGRVSVQGIRHYTPDADFDIQIQGGLTAAAGGYKQFPPGTDGSLE